MMGDLYWARRTSADGEQIYRDAVIEPLTLSVWLAGGTWCWEVRYQRCLQTRSRQGTETSEVAARRAAVQAACRLFREWLARGERELEV